jgi:hypothetical protein
MSEIQFFVAWGRDDWKYAADAKAFWEKLGLISAEERERRVSELCIMAYAEGQVIGLSTVTFAMVPQVRQRFAMYRCAVAPEYRKHDMATFLSTNTRTVMEAWSLDNPSEKVMGLGAIIQAAELRSKGLQPNWPDENLHLNLIGYTQRGEQVRIAWFRHARLPAEDEQ